MTPEQFDRFMAVLESIDRRMQKMEADSADSASALDEASRNIQKLQELYVTLDQKTDDNATVMANYVEATKDLRNESRNLHSLVREKLKAV